MSDKKYTPGPWYLDEYKHVCSDKSMLWNKRVGVNGMTLTDGEEAETNTKLIAAAPELLWALDECILALEHVEKMGIEINPPCLSSARKASAKAKGNS